MGPCSSGSLLSLLLGKDREAAREHGEEAAVVDSVFP